MKRLPGGISEGPNVSVDPLPLQASNGRGMVNRLGAHDVIFRRHILVKFLAWPAEEVNSTFKCHCQQYFQTVYGLNYP